MSDINPNIALLDQRAQALGIELKVVDTNKRELLLPGGAVSGSHTVVEMVPNDQLIRCRYLIGDERKQKNVENVSMENVLGLMASMSGTVRG